MAHYDSILIWLLLWTTKFYYYKLQGVQTHGKGCTRTWEILEDGTNPWEIPRGFPRFCASLLMKSSNVSAVTCLCRNVPHAHACKQAYHMHAACLRVQEKGSWAFHQQGCTNPWETPRGLKHDLNDSKTWPNLIKHDLSETKT